MQRGVACRLVGTMAHPLNQPRFSAREGRVVEGYGIVRAALSNGSRLPTARNSAFDRSLHSAKLAALLRTFRYHSTAYNKVGSVRRFTRHHPWLKWTAKPLLNSPNVPFVDDVIIIRSALSWGARFSGATADGLDSSIYQARLCYRPGPEELTYRAKVWPDRK
jgi:hypothetical protein